MFAGTSLRRNLRLVSIFGAFGLGTESTEILPEVTASASPTNSTPSQTTTTFQDQNTDPIEDFQTPANTATTTSAGVPTQFSDTYLALRRLFPATSFTYTVPSDGSTFNEVINFNSGVLEEDGEDSEIVMPLPDSSTEICTYDDTLSYFCLRLFENGIGLLKRFSLEANNRGSGTFHACEAIALNVTGCVTELFSAPSGVLAIAAGLPTENGPVLVSSLTDGGSYLQYLSERVPVQNSRTNLPSIGSIEAVQILVNRSINQ